MWDEVISIASTLVLSNEEDELIWQHTSSGLYSSQSLYSIINFRGITPVYLPTVWDLVVPPRVQLFLWLLSKNKILTQDNLGKRRRVDDPSCVSYSELEITNHLLFKCVVARKAWEVIYEVLGVQIKSSYESVAGKWLCNKRFGVVNMFYSVVCWSLWKLRNSLCFQEVAWKGMSQLWQKMLPMLKCWSILVPLKMMAGFDAVVSALEKVLVTPESICPRLLGVTDATSEPRRSAKRDYALYLFDPL
jgi:hypothetical protein